MPAAPRASNKAKEIAYDLLGIPACLEEDSRKGAGQRSSSGAKTGRLKIPQNNQDSRRPGV